MSENDMLPEGKAMAFDFGLARVRRWRLVVGS